MKGSVKIMDNTGHTLTPYDTERPEGYTDAETGLVYESMEVVTERIKREMEVNHSRLFALTDNKEGEMVDEFDPEKHPNVLLLPAIQGGC